MADKTGGATFPASGRPGKQHLSQEGMTLRDYFAANAMQGDWARDQCLCDVFDSVDFPDPFVKSAEVYYRMADAMLRAREK
ncbi:hypothetical protein ABM057_10725 [Morganella morganii]|uniref:hypothetical protein n=1 Tax=Morganella morganii TaxID=582 RepID=UPI003EB98C16